MSFLRKCDECGSTTSITPEQVLEVVRDWMTSMYANPQVGPENFASFCSTGCMEAARKKLPGTTEMLPVHRGN